MLKASGAVLLVAALLPMGLMAQGHPHYGHALENLRFARAVLERHQGWGPVAADQQRAISEIDRAIEEVRHAAMADGRNPNEHPPIDMHWEPRDRLQRAMDALEHAKDDIRQAEDNPVARGVRDRAFRHIDEAQRALHHAMERWHG